MLFRLKLLLDSHRLSLSFGLPQLLKHKMPRKVKFHQSRFFEVVSEGAFFELQRMIRRRSRKKNKNSKKVYYLQYRCIMYLYCVLISMSVLCTSMLEKFRKCVFTPRTSFKFSTKNHSSRNCASDNLRNQQQFQIRTFFLTTRQKTYQKKAKTCSLVK